MAKYAHAFVIPDGAKIKGGILYDKYGNLEFFADVAGLTDKANTPADKEMEVRNHEKSYYMNSIAKYGVKLHQAYRSTGIQLIKGATPGVPITLQSGDEKRDFMYSGNQSGLYAWLKDNAKVIITMYGSKGTPYQDIPVASQGG